MALQRQRAPSHLAHCTHICMHEPADGGVARHRALEIIAIRSCNSQQLRRERLCGGTERKVGAPQNLASAFLSEERLALCAQNEVVAGSDAGLSSWAASKNGVDEEPGKHRWRSIEPAKGEGVREG
jgi:hypothetical protein